MFWRIVLALAFLVLVISPASAALQYSLCNSIERPAANEIVCNISNDRSKDAMGLDDSKLSQTQVTAFWSDIAANEPTATKVTWYITAKVETKNGEDLYLRKNAGQESIEWNIEIVRVPGKIAALQNYHSGKSMFFTQDVTDVTIDGVNTSNAYVHGHPAADRDVEFDISGSLLLERGAAIYYAGPITAKKIDIQDPNNNQYTFISKGAGDVTLNKFYMKGRYAQFYSDNRDWDFTVQAGNGEDGTIYYEGQDNGGNDNRFYNFGNVTADGLTLIKARMYNIKGNVTINGPLNLNEAWFSYLNRDNTGSSLSVTGDFVSNNSGIHCYYSCLTSFDSDATISGRGPNSDSIQNPYRIDVGGNLTMNNGARIRNMNSSSKPTARIYVGGTAGQDALKMTNSRIDFDNAAPITVANGNVVMSGEYNDRTLVNPGAITVSNGNFNFINGAYSTWSRGVISVSGNMEINESQYHIYPDPKNITVGGNFTVIGRLSIAGNDLSLHYPDNISVGGDFKVLKGAKEAWVYSTNGNITVNGALETRDSLITFNASNNSPRVIEASGITLQGGYSSCHGLSPCTIYLDADLTLRNRDESKNLTLDNAKIATGNDALYIESCSIPTTPPFAPKVYACEGLTVSKDSDSSISIEQTCNTATGTLFKCWSACPPCGGGPGGSCQIGALNPSSFSSPFTGSTNFDITVQGTTGGNPTIDCGTGTGSCTGTSSPFSCTCNYTSLQASQFISANIGSIACTPAVKQFTCNNCGGGGATHTNEIAIGAFIANKDGSPVTGELEINISIDTGRGEAACNPIIIPFSNGVVDYRVNCGGSDALKLVSGEPHQAVVKITRQSDGKTETKTISFIP